MRITDFKVFDRVPTLDSIASYLRSDLGEGLRDLANGLKRLTLGENFESFEVTVDIPATTEIQIENKLRNGAIPSKRIIVRSNVSAISDGSTEWTRTHVSLKNESADDATLTVIFLK